MTRLLLTALALFMPSFAAAHSFWLQPENPEAEPGEPIEVRFKVGDAGDVSDWGLYWERVAAFQLYSEDAVLDQQSAMRMTDRDELGTASIVIDTPGVHVLAFASNPSFSDLEADRFNRYLDHEGLSAIAADREARGSTKTRGTELYARRAKTLLKIGTEGAGSFDDSVLTKPIGQTLEIVPLSNPFALKQGEPLKLSVLWRGKPLPGAIISAARLDATGEPVIQRTDAVGQASVTVEPGKRYLISCVWGAPAPNDARADYFTIFASLTF